jgi:hypothetical protein
MKASAAIATAMERTFHEDQKVIYDFPPLRDSPVIRREKVLPCCSNSLRSRPRGRKTLVENFGSCPNFRLERHERRLNQLPKSPEAGGSSRCKIWLSSDHSLANRI